MVDKARNGQNEQIKKLKKRIEDLQRDLNNAKAKEDEARRALDQNANKDRELENLRNQVKRLGVDNQRLDGDNR